MQGELVQDATKKNQYVNTVDCNRSFQIRNPATIHKLISVFHFLLHKFQLHHKFCITVDACMLYIIISLLKFRCTHKDVTVFGNTRDVLWGPKPKKR